MNKTTIINSIPIPMPTREILSRLGYRPASTQMTDAHRKRIEGLMARGFALCEPRGAALKIGIIGTIEGRIELENGAVFQSAALAKMLAGCAAVMLMAATVGPGPGQEAARAAAEGDASTALVYDAVGSEAADSALDWVQRYCARTLVHGAEILTARRFSPGYGDLELKYQKVIFDLMGLGHIGIGITPRFQLQPEKSVIGIAGIAGGLS